MDSQQTLIIVIVITICSGLATCLQCWHCVADDCNTEPADNYKARKKACIAGQSCQKVYFEMYDETLNEHYISTVRGCSSGCALKNDFLNCTNLLRTTRGCVRKDCCSDSDLCNRADMLNATPTINVINFVCLAWLVWFR